MSESLTVKQVAEHNTVDKGLYIIIDGDVYKLDTFVEEHPGGSKILKRVGGKDASKQFWKVSFSFLSSFPSSSSSSSKSCWGGEIIFRWWWCKGKKGWEEGKNDITDEKSFS